jgi:vitellogenic carboxypeptidase-like protein
MKQFMTADKGCVKKEGLTKLDTSSWFIFGESYAGKFVPAFAQYIL